jgi:SAM-dependent methyltransferase
MPSYVLEVGGIDRPLLARNDGFAYHGLDIEEKDGCQEIYDDFMVQSIEKPVTNGAYDLIISITVLEHVPDNAAAVTNIHSALKSGGVTHHYIPAKWHPYSIALQMVGPTWQRRLIGMLRSDAVEVTGYPTFFDHCSVREMKALFLKCGFVNIDVQPYWRANDYFAFFVPLYIAVSAFENLCAYFNWTALSSGFVISAKRL